MTTTKRKWLHSSNILHLLLLYGMYPDIYKLLHSMENVPKILYSYIDAAHFHCRRNKILRMELLQMAFWYNSAICVTLFIAFEGIHFYLNTEFVLSFVSHTGSPFEYFYRFLNVKRFNELVYIILYESMTRLEFV